MTNFSGEVDSQIPIGKVRLPGARWLRNRNIGIKLSLAFSFLVALTFLTAGASYFGSYKATVHINLADDVQVPAALIADRAQTNLLEMLSDVRGYLILGEQSFLERYNLAIQAFNAELDKLHKLESNLSSETIAHVREIEDAYKIWLPLPGHLFELRNDQLDREPAYRLLVTDGTRLAGSILITINEMIESQAQREPTAKNIHVMGDMAKFQGSFAAMFSGLRGYVTTRNRIFKQEYEANLVANSIAWDTISNQRALLSGNQKIKLHNMAKNREVFLNTIPDQVFERLEGENWREDLYMFKTKILPVAAQMYKSLRQLTEDQKTLLKTGLGEGRRDLADANWIILAGGLVALMCCIVMAYLSNRNIAGPVRRLTHVAEQIRSGDLVVRAEVESGDEVGVLAETFNNMTDQLQQTLGQVRKEKERADNLLEVVIPLGVRLSLEKDFNQLLENTLLEAKSFCHADAGTLYLRTDDNCLKYVKLYNDSLRIALGGASGIGIPFPPLPLVDPVTGEPNHRNVATHVALSGASVNITGEAQARDAGFSGFFEQNDPNGNYQVTSVLAIPLKNSLNQILGVLELFNAREPETGQTIPFDHNLQQLMESFSLLAVAALEGYIREQSLKQEIQQLRIEIDEAKRQKQVSEIVDSEFFQDLRAKARNMRKRSESKEKDSSETS